MRQSWRMITKTALVLILLALLLPGCSGDGDSTTPTEDGGTSADGNGSADVKSDAGGTATKSPVYPDFEFTLVEGDFWQFGWDYSYQSYAQGSGSSSDNDSGAFWIVLGAPQTIDGITAYAVEIYGDSKVTDEDYDFAPRWKYLALSDNVLLGSTDGVILETIFDAQVGAWAGGGFFASFASDALVTTESGTISNDYVNTTAIKAGQSASQSQCEYFPGVGNICGDESHSYTENEYYLDGVGPIGYYYYDSSSYSSGGFYSSYQWKHNVGLMASSFDGDSLPSSLQPPTIDSETEPNDTIDQAQPLTYGSSITGTIDVGDSGSSNDAITEFVSSAGGEDISLIQDWYSMTTIGLAEEVIEFELDFSQYTGTTDLDIFLLDASGSYVSGSSYTNNASDGVYLEAISLSLHGFTTPATYYLAVMAYNTPQATTYTLTLKNQP